MTSAFYGTLVGAANGYLVNDGDPLELLTNDGWADEGSMTIVDGNAMCDPEVELGQIFQDLPAEQQSVNRPFRIEIVITSITQGYLMVASQEAQLSTPGTHIIYMADSPAQFALQSFDFCDAEIDLVSLKLLNDNQLGAELVTSNTFASATGWVLTDNPEFAIVGGALVASNPDTEECYAVNTDCAIEALSMYKIVVVIGAAPVGGLIGVVIETAPDEYDGTLYDNSWDVAGTFTVYAVADEAGAAALYFTDYAEISVDSISIRKYA